MEVVRDWKMKPLIAGGCLKNTKKLQFGNQICTNLTCACTQCQFSYVKYHISDRYMYYVARCWIQKTLAGVPQPSDLP